jgi:hypothetical protein
MGDHCRARSRPDTSTGTPPHRPSEHAFGGRGSRPGLRQSESGARALARSLVDVRARGHADRGFSSNGWLCQFCHERADPENDRFVVIPGAQPEPRKVSERYQRDMESSR